MAASLTVASAAPTAAMARAARPSASLRSSTAMAPSSASLRVRVAQPAGRRAMRAARSAVPSHVVASAEASKGECKRLAWDPSRATQLPS